ncbi:MAG: hypothetical protein INF91_01680 [Alphaproteobacteria bacterium]|nr:hypothetical protein [Alphaproteobacteria bacterium]
MIRSLLPLAVIALAAPALAEPVSDVRTLSDADRAAMDAAAEQRALEAPLDGPATSRRIHGTMEMMVGTGGRTGLAMSMVAPLGDDGYLVLAYAAEHGRYGPRDRHRR